MSGSCNVYKLLCDPVLYFLSVVCLAHELAVFASLGRTCSRFLNFPRFEGWPVLLVNEVLLVTH